MLVFGKPALASLQDREFARGFYLEKGGLLDIQENEGTTEKAFVSCFHLCWLAVPSCISGKESLHQFS